VLDLPYDRVESLISEISLGGRIVLPENSQGEKIPIFLKHCTGVHKLHADMEYNVSYEKAIKNGFMSVQQTTDLLINRGVFNPDDEKVVKDLREKIKGQEAVLGRTTRVPANRDRVKQNIKTLESKIFEILSAREEKLSYCAENVAREDKYLYMVWIGSLIPETGERYWKTRKDFDDCQDIIFRHNMLIEYIKMANGIYVETIRYIARHNLWRIRYLTSVKTGESLFGISIPEYTVDQLSLAWWSQYYQSVFEMLPDEKPSDSVIKDDAALDAFMKSYSEEKDREAAASRQSKGRGKGVKPAWSHGDVVVTKSNELYDDLKGSYSPTVESIRNKGKTDIKDKGKKIN
jgi:hypothetical protein